MKLLPFLIFLVPINLLLTSMYYPFLMFILGGLVDIEENCEILSGCLPTVFIKCQHSSQRTGKGNVCHVLLEKCEY